jgi:hypothetical protein
MNQSSISSIIKSTIMKSMIVFFKLLPACTIILFMLAWSDAAKSQVVMPVTVCYGEPVYLFCTLDNCGIPGATYTWTNSSGSWTSGETNCIIFPGTTGYANDLIDLVVEYSPPIGGRTEGMYSINFLPQITLSGTATDVQCFGSSTGGVSVTVSGGAEPYAYQWDNGSASDNVYGLAAGTYHVTVTDMNNCAVTGAFAITEPTGLALTSTSISVSCNGGSDGSIDLFVSGGVLPYSYSWSTGMTTMNIDSLMAGDYSVIVTDQHSCSISETFYIAQAVMYCNLFIQDKSISGGRNVCYDATQTITAAGDGTTYTIQSGDSATMIAGQKITYRSGTTIFAGAYLHGYITADGQYCPILKSSPFIASDENEKSDRAMPEQPVRNIFNVYPNPTNGLITIDLTNMENPGPLQIEIFSMQNQKLYVQRLASSQTHTISLSDTPNGIYLLRMRSNGQVASVKIVKQ